MGHSAVARERCSGDDRTRPRRTPGLSDFDRVRLRVDIADPTLRAVEPRVIAARGLRPGDLLLGKSGGDERQPVGAVVLYDHTSRRLKLHGSSYRR